MAELFPFPACLYTFLVVILFIRLQTWMTNNGLPIPDITHQIKNAESNCSRLEDSESNPSSEFSICVIDDGNQERQDLLEKCDMIDEPRGLPALLSLEAMRNRHKKLVSSTLKINDVIIASFNDLISKIKEMIGDGKTVSIPIHEILLRQAEILCF